MEISEFNENCDKKVAFEGNLTELQIQLNKLYEKNNYPTKQEMEEIVHNHETTLKKVTNWFKQKRRRQFLKGKLQKQNYKKNWFSNEQIAFLKKWFAQNMHPTNQEYIELAKQLNTTQKHIKNWFSHQRQKLTKITNQNKNNDQQQNQTSLITPQNYAFLHQILQSMPLPQRLQLVLGTAESQQIVQNLTTPYQMNNQCRILQFLQNQQYLNSISNIIQNYQRQEVISPASTIQQFPFQQQNNIAQQPKQSFKLVAKNEY
eukprot:TRINITY_DN14421_c0_g1_i3.p1 TRINITY_DN14421_c0_g1~~TRINITY_DN14421_c0_g1_i3.p1  ORF type:complete len:260 (-),score=26.08 TRINITY_DN14421_c0_g1_i3:49-828(-)